jgi:Ca2+-binding RTX toxin-like protein
MLDCTDIGPTDVGRPFERCYVFLCGPGEGAVLIHGTYGRDQITGGPGDDLIRGLGGDDLLSGGDGDDTLIGGPGDDTLRSDAGDDLLVGGAGADRAIIEREAGATGRIVARGGVGDDMVTFALMPDGPVSQVSDVELVLRGGGGDDLLSARGAGHISLNGQDGDDRLAAFDVAGGRVSGGDGADLINIAAPSARLRVDAGAGDDHLVLFTTSESRLIVRLGEGADRVEIQPGSPHSTLLDVEFRDFAAGDGGDHLDLYRYADRAFTGWFGGDPFHDGFLRLIQDGQDAVLQLDRDAVGSRSDWRDWLVFRHASVADFTAYNFEGFDPGNQPGGIAV